MGKILNILSKAVPIRIKSLWHNICRIERCECIHVHWRNIRLTMTDEQFSDFGNSVECSTRSIWRAIQQEFMNKTKEDFVLDEIDISDDMTHENISIEMIELNGKKIHFHYKELRMEFDIDEFKQLCSIFKNASDELEKIQGIPESSV